MKIQPFKKINFNTTSLFFAVVSMAFFCQIAPVQADTIAPTSTLNVTSTTLEIASTTADNTSTTRAIVEHINDTIIINEIISAGDINTAVQKIFDYLKSQQDTSGKIIDGNITDWSIMSFGTKNIYADDVGNTGASLLNYEKNYNLDDPSDLNSCASYPRHILALLAAGVGTNDPAIKGLRNKMSSVCYQNNQYGLDGINDDVFGLIAILAAGESSGATIVSDMVINILNWQLDNGAFSWPDWSDPTKKVAGGDITGAAINALKYAISKGVRVNSDVFTKAKNYLQSSQQADGGWNFGYGGPSDVMTTSWVLMGINALGEGQNNWFTASGTNPWYPLIKNLNADGFYESYGQPDWFALKHAVPALVGKSWPIILPQKITRFETGDNVTYINRGTSYNPGPAVNEIVSASSTPTTTINTDADVASSTTSTVDISDILTATSTLVTTTINITTATLTTSTLNNFSIQITSTTIATNTDNTIIIKKRVINKKILPSVAKTETTVNPPTATQAVKGEKIYIDEPASNNKEKITITTGSVLTAIILWGIKLLKNLL